MLDLTVGDIESFTGTSTNLTQGQIAAALQIARGYCRWHVAPERVETIIADGSGGCTVTLPTLHLSDVTDIRVDGVSDPSVEWWSNGTLRRSAGFADRPRLVEVDVTHGSPMDEVPELVMAVTSIANRIVTATGGPDTTPNVEEKAIGSFRIRWTAQSTQQVDLTMAERVALENHRISLL